MRKLLFIAILVVQMTSSITAQTPMNGIYTVGGSNPDFMDVSLALSALNTNGLNAPVTFNLRAGNYVSSNFIISNQSYNFPVTIKSEGNSASQVRLKIGFISDCRNWIFKHIEIISNKNTGSLAYPYKGIDITRSSEIYFDSCSFLRTTNLSTENGISVRGGRGTVITNCTFNNLKNAIVFSDIDFWGSNRHYGNHIIKNNHFINCSEAAIRLAGEFRDSADISHNKITGGAYGIRIRGQSESVDHTYIHHNEIINTSNFPISTLNNDGGNQYWPLKIYNNMIVGGVPSTSFASGTSINTIVSIYLDEDENTQVFNNSLTGALEINDTRDVLYKNNIISNNNSPALIIDYNSTGFQGETNCYFRSMNRVLIIDNWISYNTLSSYRLTFPTKEINSISEDPLFVSSTDLHCNNIKIRGKGTSVSWIKTDFDDQIRDSITPDIGADEFKNDTTKSAVAYFNSQCSGSLSLQLIDSSMRAKNVIWIVNSIDTLWSRNPVYKFITPGIHSVKQVAFDYIGTGFNSITSNVTVSNYERITSHTLDSISISPLHSNYRWFRNGGLVPNGTSNSYKVLFNGTYWAEYADSLGCILTSDSINIILVGSREQSLTKDIVSFYPNPFKNHLTVIIKQNIKVEKYKIIDTQGKTIQIINELKNKEILNLHHLNKGIYFIEIGLDNRIERYKLIKH